MMAGNPNWWNMYLHPPSYVQLPPSQAPPSTIVSSSSSSSSSPPPPLAQPTHNPQPFSDNSFVDHETLPRSWSQLLLGGLPVEEVGHFQTRKLGNWESEDDKMASRTPGANAVSPSSNNSNSEAYPEELLLPLVMPMPWEHTMMPVSSPTSCLTSLSGGNVWDFSKTTKELGKNQISAHSSECKSTATGGASKKARVHPPRSSQPPLKVRKEKLGDRITALYQLVSPFGKTDTATVFLEAIGYIRFLQAQIEALSSPYMRNNNGSGNMGTNHHRHPVHGEAGYSFSGDTAQDNHDKPMDLRSRGLCLVPVSCTAQVGNENGADYWAPAYGGGF
ncbi:hypothetical protein MLD38_004875 [Melastoma candidum]|uniref:Uncharacterized protein n=1 Tax=Melastoma candidum TaxID=119954 RepID=A0ACB9SAD8_9MYRT|nr:hypothetical protein MLD38_004875 [Melastoma candidum]